MTNYENDEVEAKAAFRPDDFFTAAQQARLSYLMERFRAARDAGQALPPAEYQELESLVQAEVVGVGKRAEAILARIDDMAKFAALLRDKYPDAFVELEKFSSQRTDLCFQSSTGPLFVIEYKANQGYGISRINNSAEGFLRGHDFFSCDFPTVKTVFLEWIGEHMVFNRCAS